MTDTYRDTDDFTQTRRMDQSDTLAPDTISSERVAFDRGETQESVSSADLTTGNAAHGETGGTAAFAGMETPAAPRSDMKKENTPLFPADEIDGLRGRWDEVQASFVDEPRRAVEDADNLVASAMKRLAETFAKERSNLEGQWDREGQASTEDLRIAMQRYRSFFSRLLAI